MLRDAKLLQKDERVAVLPSRKLGKLLPQCNRAHVDDSEKRLSGGLGQIEDHATAPLMKFAGYRSGQAGEANVSAPNGASTYTSRLLSKYTDFRCNIPSTL